MPNPNKNKHFNDEALRINRILKKENDSLNNIIKELKEDIDKLKGIANDNISKDK